MIKTKKGFIMRRLGDEYMIIAIGEASASFNGMVRTNELGAFLWEQLEKGATREELFRSVMDRYEDAPAEAVQKDIARFLESVSMAVEEK